MDWGRVNVKICVLSIECSDGDNIFYKIGTEMQ